MLPSRFRGEPNSRRDCHRCSRSFISSSTRATLQPPARTADATDWARIVALYTELAEIAPSPIIELNRAVAVAMAFGPAAGLEIVDALMSEPSLKEYHLLPSVRGDFLKKLARFDE